MLKPTVNFAIYRCLHTFTHPNIVYVMKQATTGKLTTIIVNYKLLFKSKEFTEKFIRFYADPHATSYSQLFKDIRNELGMTTLLTKYGIDTDKLSAKELEQIDDSNLVKTNTEQSIIQELGQACAC